MNHYCQNTQADTKQWALQLHRNLILKPTILGVDTWGIYDKGHYRLSFEERFTHLVRLLSTTSVYDVAGVSPETAVSQRQVTLARLKNTQSIRRGGLMSAYEVGIKTEDEINGMELMARSSTSSHKEGTDEQQQSS